MKCRGTVVLGAFAILALYSHAALAQGTPAQQGFPGHWKLNLKKSDLTSLYGSSSISGNLVIEEVGPAKVKYKTTFLTQTEENTHVPSMPPRTVPTSTGGVAMGI
jgi:hypothetical protein